jgi:hypothetical protein
LTECGRCAYLAVVGTIGAVVDCVVKVGGDGAGAGADVVGVLVPWYAGET